MLSSPCGLIRENDTPSQWGVKALKRFRTKGCHPECSLWSREAGPEQAKDLYTPRRPPHISAQIQSGSAPANLAGVLAPLSSGMHGSFVPIPSRSEGLRFRRMTAGESSKLSLYRRQNFTDLAFPETAATG